MLTAPPPSSHLSESGEDSLQADFALEATPLRREGRQFFDDAGIVTRLEPQVKLTANSVVRIVGYDGPSFTPDYIWLKTLRQWIDEAGCEVRYLLLAPSECALDGIEQLRGSLLHPERLHVYSIDRNKALDGPTEQLLDEWKTFHFAIIENPDQLWVETNHPVGQKNAKDCFYAPPERAIHSASFVLYRVQFDYIVSEYGVVIERNKKALT